MDERRQGDRDGFASGTRNDDAGAEDGVARPGVTGGGANYLPESEDRAGARGENRGSDAAAAEGTVGAVGEMDFTGAPAGTSGAGGVSGGSPAGESRGGGTGEGAQSTGGTGPAPAQGDPGPQSAESTTAFLGDREASHTGEASGTGGDRQT